MDLERLHDHFGQKQTLFRRGAGQTYDMLVEAIHQAGSVDTVCVCAAYFKDVQRLVCMFVEIAEDMGYVYRLEMSDRLRVVTPEGTTRYKFTVATPATTRGADLVLEDHYHGD